MKMKKTLQLLLIIAGMALFLGACRSDDPDGPVLAVRAYLNGIVNQDENAMIAASCADWEAQARQEFTSFAAVRIALEGPSCSETSRQGNTAVVTCTGRIVANYGAEDLVIELADRPYKVVRDAGEWRMCGYQ